MSRINRIQRLGRLYTELQSEQVQSNSQKFAPTLALKWCPQDLIG